ncbi:MAG: peptide deformylase [Actinobacteria bacterium]|nr:peptide deformylase [Actinomycetota bacterium]
MSIRSVVTLPNQTLVTRAKTVERIGEAEKALCVDLVDTMRASPACVGLAAQQVGELIRVFVVDVTEHPKAKVTHGLITLFNPEIISTSGHEVAREGCMSIPHFTGDVERATHVVVRGQCPGGEEVIIETEGFEARALLHEIDHLDGKVFLDRVTGPHAIFKRRTYR